MVALWGALKSVLRKGDVVVSVCNGVYGNGIADMASRLGAVVHKVYS
jgi:aspartate aminotransferase-like enzyme